MQYDEFIGQVRARARLEAFVSEVSWLTGVPPERARYRAQAVLATKAERDPELVDSLDLPEQIRAMCVDPAPAGGIVGPTGHTAPLTAAEVSAALADLPDWTGDIPALTRTLTLPPGNLDRVLDRIALIHRNIGRGPEVRRDGNTAVLTARTHAVDGVTALDLDLAAHVDAVIRDAGAGIS